MCCEEAHTPRVCYLAAHGTPAQVAVLGQVLLHSCWQVAHVDVLTAAQHEHGRVGG